MPQADNSRKRFRSWPNKLEDAFHGISAGMRGQSSFRVHFLVAVAVVIVGGSLSLSVSQWCLLMLCITCVYVSEMFNSALEQIAESITTDFDERIGRSLDIASGAVLIAAMGSSLVGLLIFGSRIGTLTQWW